MKVGLFCRLWFFIYRTAFARYCFIAFGNNRSAIRACGGRFSHNGIAQRGFPISQKITTRPLSCYCINR